MKTYTFIFVMLLVFATAVFMAGCSGNGSKAEKNIELQLAAAASLTEVMAELTKEYSKQHPEVHFTLNTGSSGALQQAIENGGQADLFFSAGLRQMDMLEKSGCIYPETRVNILMNSLVLVVPNDSDLNITSLQDLARKDIKPIAIGDKGVPAGQYAQQLLERLELESAVKGRLVLASDVRQVLTWTAMGEADCGLVYATDAFVSPEVKVVCEAPQGSIDPIIYPAAVVKNSRYYDESNSFIAFVRSPQGISILESYGFKRAD